MKMPTITSAGPVAKSAPQQSDPFLGSKTIIFGFMAALKNREIDVSRPSDTLSFPDLKNIKSVTMYRDTKTNETYLNVEVSKEGSCTRFNYSPTFPDKTRRYGIEISDEAELTPLYKFKSEDEARRNLPLPDGVERITIQFKDGEPIADSKTVSVKI